MTLTCTLTDRHSLLAWAGIRCTGGQPWNWGHDARAMGVIDKETGRIRAAIVLNAFYDDAATAHIASDGTRGWATPLIMRGLFHYVFVALELDRCMVSIDTDNRDAIILAIKMGFTIEGRIRASLDGSKSNTIGIMFANECSWIKGDKHG